MGSTTSRSMPKSEQKKSVSKSLKAGLTFPVSRVGRHIKESHCTKKVKRVGQFAPVFATAVIEYIAAELLECGGKVTMDAKRKRITISDISTAVRTDPELCKLLRGSILFTGERLTGISAAVTMAPKPAKDAAPEKAPPAQETPPSRSEKKRLAAK